MDLMGGGVVMDAGGGASELGLLGGGGSSGRLLKHGRGNAAAGADDHGWGSGGGRAKQARTTAASVVPGDVVEAAKAAAPFLLGVCSPGHGGEQMLSFSSAAPAAASSCASTAAVAVAAAVAADGGAMPLYYGTPASCSGLSSVSLSTGMQGAMARVRGPFTPSQWIELEHQALIYKYLAANSPIPHSLLIPIRRSLASSPYPPSYFGTTSTLGWGSFQLGYPGNADLEPGRCRRTDGKKWRCSRDAVADQKYCERHMNRGRHRSRKHVEGQPAGHAAKAMSAVVAAAATQPAALAGAGATAAGLTVNQHQQSAKSYATGATDPCSLQYNRELVNKQNENENMQDSDNLSMLTSMNTGNTGSVFPFSKQNTNPFEVTSSRPEFGLVSSDSLMSSPHSSLENVNLLSSQSLNEHQSSASLQHFVDWPRTPAQGGLSWPEAEDMQAQRSQLSISAPMASSELSSASTSPIHEKLMLSPLKLSREYSPTGQSIAANRDEVSQLEATWATMFRDSSMGGPLGEVLNKNGNVEAKNCLAAPLNLLTDYWDSSHGMESSPVGVLQKTAIGSVSSSTGSSPRIENHGAYDGISNLRDDLGSIVVSHPSIRLV